MIEVVDCNRCKDYLYKFAVMIDNEMKMLDFFYDGKKNVFCLGKIDIIDDFDFLLRQEKIEKSVNCYMRFFRLVKGDGGGIY